MGAPTASEAPDTSWDETQCTIALANLERLQAQLDELRLALPRIIQPFHQPTDSTTFRLYAQGIRSSQDGVKTLSDDWKSAQTQDIFEHIKKSLAANGDLAPSTSIPSHGWVQRVEKGQEFKRKGNNVKSTKESNVTLSDQDISEIFVQFEKQYPRINLETKHENRELSMKFVSGVTMLNFRIIIERETNVLRKLSGECLGTREPFLSITRCIASRPLTNDLKMLLDMVAAYKTNQGESCAKCEKLLDNTMLTPTARRCKRVLTTKGTTDLVWEALHESCLV